MVSASGKSALLFWYRDAVYAVEPRSPAEGAYSEGFLEARLTQVRRTCLCAQEQERTLRTPLKAVHLTSLHLRVSLLRTAALSARPQRRRLI